MKKYCCSFMESQLTHTCPQHGSGRDCPDVVISENSQGVRFLEATNATYSCIFCPVCGAKHQPSDDYHNQE